jgi:hypothetical protein
LNEQIYLQKPIRSLLKKKSIEKNEKNADQEINITTIDKDKVQKSDLLSRESI